jgi:hypothetical protein
LSPEQRASATVLDRLRQEIALVRAALARHVAAAGRLHAAWRDGVSDEILAAAMFTVHAWYTGFEVILEKVARDLDDEVPKGDSWHRDLLRQGAMELTLGRPAVFPRSIYADLKSLLETRHFLRHASAAVDLDPGQTLEALNRLLRVAPEIEVALDSFDRFLADALAAVTRD